MKRDIKWRYLWVATGLSLPLFLLPVRDFFGPFTPIMAGFGFIFLGLFVASFLPLSDKDNSEGQYEIRKKLGRKALFSLSAVCFLLIASQFVPSYILPFPFPLLVFIFALPLSMVLCIAGFKSK